MASDSILLDKSLNFAARIVKLHKYLVREKKETIISKQIVRSGTSIGANANEAVYGVSKADFIAKLQISLKETAETEYWLRLLILSEYITEQEGDSLLRDCLEIKRILVSTLNTAKNSSKGWSVMLDLTTKIKQISIATGKRILVTSDIHGHLSYFKKVLENGCAKPHGYSL